LVLVLRAIEIREYNL